MATFLIVFIQGLSFSCPSKFAMPLQMNWTNSLESTNAFTQLLLSVNRDNYKCISVGLCWMQMEHIEHILWVWFASNVFLPVSIKNLWHFTLWQLLCKRLALCIATCWMEVSHKILTLKTCSIMYMFFPLSDKARIFHLCSVNISAEDVLYWKEKGILPLLEINSMRDVVRIFVNGELAGNGFFFFSLNEFY